MKIHQLNLEKHNNYHKISAMLGPFPLWFKTSSECLIACNDASPFLCSALIPAMFLGEDIEIDRRYYVSASLLEKLPLIQTMMHAWNPIFKCIKVNVNTQTFKPSASQLGHSAFFSGGVDGTYNLIKHQEQLDNLVLINGFDFSMPQPAWQQLVARCQKTAKLFNKRLICVESNLKEFTGWTGLARFANFGASLASVSLLLNPKSMAISGAVTYDAINPSNSHPLLDPLWSSESCQISHLGLEADRAAKIALIKHYPEALDNLWVCWEDPSSNCGRCSKCHRTYMALQLNNISHFQFSQEVEFSALNKLSPKSDEDLSFYEYLYQLAIKQHNRQLSQVLRKIIWRYRAKAFARETDRLILHSVCSKWRQKKIAHHQLADVNVFPKYSDAIQLERLHQRIKQNPRFISSANIGSIFD
ncbi:hypothetical protein [Agarivorans albus]|uniref:Uncharacterized protein n=1 Tax=Agarivorans albus MKT 106 TaxID=1331007 RepID=R9PJY9_AGAAL|nr:hypothetical protein [Agarivorans albus]GAD01573.1 hypothetical protein AALB_1653 [Agarivorans albus MKT 106]